MTNILIVKLICCFVAGFENQLKIDLSVTITTNFDCFRYGLMSKMLANNDEKNTVQQSIVDKFLLLRMNLFGQVFAYRYKIRPKNSI